ncbi:MAG: MATE family efflux transporter [Candidatus Altiarchaeota archaeon]|nr:MATE family efflux transporter [Candidatus Altiarchaeota archaeon]
MTQDFTRGGLYKTIFHASLPTIIAFIIQSTFSLVDAIFVGWISSHALAAVSVSFPIVFMVIALGVGLGLGSTSVVARYVGAKKSRYAKEAAEHSMLLAVAFGIILMVAGLTLSPSIFKLMGVEESLMSTALVYLNILLFFAPFELSLIVGNSILRGEGDMRTPMVVMGASAILNGILDPIFIFTLGWGVEGAAWATVVARMIGFTYLAYNLKFGGAKFKLDYVDFRYRFTYFKEVLRIGIPSSMSNIVMSTGMAVFTAIVAGFGTDALAAFGVGFRLDSLAILPGIGVATAVISIVGQNIGAGKADRAMQTTLKAGAMASALMVLFGIPFYLFSTDIVSIFNQEPKVIEYGASFLRIIPLTYLVVGFNMCIGGAFIGAGKAKLALFNQFSRVMLFSVPLAYMLSVKIGLEGVWWGITIGSYLSVALSLTLYKYVNWTKSTH